MDYSFEKEIIEHYKNAWNNFPKIEIWVSEKESKKIDHFKVLEFSPTKNRDMWTYATCGMSTINEKNPIELHIFSRKQDKKLIELLTATAYYHRENNIGLFHTINFGKSWQENSKCTYGLISLPYLDGPNLENLYVEPLDKNLKFYWLLPIYENEMAYKMEYGIEKLEDKFEETSFNYHDPNRKSVVL